MQIETERGNNDINTIEIQSKFTYSESQTTTVTTIHKSQYCAI